MSVDDTRSDFDDDDVWGVADKGWQELDPVSRTDPVGPASNLSDEPDEEAQSDPPDGDSGDSSPVEFDPRWRDEFEGLLYVGSLTDEFFFMGHKFIIRTITTDEVLEVGLLHKPFVGSLGDVRAYQTLVAAAAIVSVDDQPLPLPITDTAEDTMLRNRFDYVRRYHPPVIDAVYERSLMLEQKVQEVIEAMGKASG